MSIRLLIALILTMSILQKNACADTPSKPPHKIRFISQNQKFQIISDTRHGTQIMDRNNKMLWKIPGWFHAAFISNDGEYCVTEYDGLNLIPKNYRDDLVMLTFWKHGKVLRKLTLKDIVPDRQILKETNSHYYWGNTLGIDEQEKFGLERADGKRLYFDVRTGKLLNV